MHIQNPTGKKSLELIGSISLIIITIANVSSFWLSSSLYTVRALGSEGSSPIHDPFAGTLYIGNPQSNTISVINLTKNTIVNNITVAMPPRDIKLSEDQLRLYVTDLHSGTIAVINTTTNEPIKQILTPASISDIAIFNGTLYLADASGGNILVIDKNGSIANRIEVDTPPQDIEIRPDGHVLYFAGEDGHLSAVDLKLNKTMREIDSGDRPRGLYFSRDGAKLFLVNAKSDTLSVIDSYRHEMIKTILVGHNPQSVVLSPDERFAYVTNSDSNTVSVVDAQKIELTNEIAVGNGPYGITASADGDLIYVSNIRGNDISIINTTSNRVVATLPSVGVGVHPLLTRNPGIYILKAANNYSSSDAVRVFVEVADDEGETSRGIMFRKNLPWDAGMYFVFYNEEPQTFWMKNTLIPLDMMFLDSNSTIVDIKENVPPCPTGEECPLYPSREPAQYVLEVNAGFVQENGIKIGDRFETTNEF
jgi:YVTN family beta-propeller protein